MNPYSLAAVFVLGAHLLFILWVILGAFFTRGRPFLRRLHIASLLWGVLIEVFPWTCPLTFVENWLQARAGRAQYSGSFLLHYLDKIVYPDLPPVVLTLCGVAVCLANIAFYVLSSRQVHG